MTTQPERLEAPAQGLGSRIGIPSAEIRSDFAFLG
jgi:hypothetical protein